MRHTLRASLFVLFIACPVQAQVIVNPPASGGGGGGTTSPGAPENAVQFNIGSVFTGDSQFTFDATLKHLHLGPPPSTFVDADFRTWLGADPASFTKQYISFIGAPTGTWIGLTVQGEQTNDDAGIAGIYTATRLAESASGNGPAIGVNADLFVDVGPGNANEQAAFEASVSAAGQGNGNFQIYQSRFSQDGAGTVNHVHEFVAQGISLNGAGTVGEWAGVAVGTGGSPTANAIGIKINDLSGLTSTTKHAINYGNGKFVVDSAGNVLARTLKAAALTFADLPTCNAGAEGGIQAVTNANVTTWGATVTGTGTDHILAYCNGVNWTVLAK